MNQMLKIAELISTVMDRELGPLEKEALVAIRVSYDGKVEAHVGEHYFEEHFSDIQWTRHEQPRYNNIRLSFETDSGIKVFCLKKALFGVVG